MPEAAQSLSLPIAPRGRPSAAAKAAYNEAVLAWCAAIEELRSRLDFSVSARGWCYLLEEHGLSKGEFDKAEELIAACRKSGKLPLNICADDVSRGFDGLEELDESDPEEHAADWIYTLKTAHENYAPFSFWDAELYYLQLLVEKIDLKSLFADICDEFYIPRANAKGWTDLNGRAAMMRRFRAAECRGQIPVLLYCGDLDPAGCLISDTLRSNLADLADVVGWHPRNLLIDRFGLNADFVSQHGLTWIDGLKTGSGKDLADVNHDDHWKPYVQQYLAEHGARKVEANALVANPDAGRALMRATIRKYIPDDAPQRYQDRLKPKREELRVEILRQLRELADGEA